MDYINKNNVDLAGSIQRHNTVRKTIRNLNDQID